MVGQLSVIAMGHNCSTGALGTRPNKLTDVRYYQGDPHVLVFSSDAGERGISKFSSSMTVVGVNGSSTAQASSTVKPCCVRY